MRGISVQKGLLTKAEVDCAQTGNAMRRLKATFINQVDAHEGVGGGANCVDLVRQGSGRALGFQGFAVSVQAVWHGAAVTLPELRYRMTGCATGSFRAACKAANKRVV